MNNNDYKEEKYSGISFGEQTKRDMVFKLIIPECSSDLLLDYDFGVNTNDVIQGYYKLQGLDMMDTDTYPEYFFDALNDWYDKSLYYRNALREVREGEVKLSERVSLMSSHTSFLDRLEVVATYFPAVSIYAFLRLIESEKEVEVNPLDKASSDDEEIIERMRVLIAMLSKLERHKFKGDNTEVEALNMVWEFVKRGPIPYEAQEDGGNLKNGQKKLMIAFLHFLSELNNPKVVCFFGAAPGFAIVRVAEIMGIRLICVDDFPVARNDNNLYVTYTDAFFQGVLGNVDFDGVFMDMFFPDESYEDQYLAFVNWLSDFPGMPYSIKRFIPISGGMSAIPNSRIGGMVFSSSDSMEVRENGIVGEDCEVEQRYSMDDSLRYYNQKVRLGKRRGVYILPCNCFDCSFAEFTINSVAVGGDKLIAMYQLFLKVDKREISLSRIELQHLMESLPAGDYNGLSKMRRNEQFVWDGKLFHGNYLSLGVNAGDYCVSTSNSFFGPGISQEDNSFSDLTQDDLKLRGTYRYHKPAMFAEMHTDTGLLKSYALPRVNVTAINGKELYYAPRGSKLVYSWKQRGRAPNCVDCQFNDHGKRVSFRDYIAAFNPTKFDCPSCGMSASIAYKEICIR